jgi:5-methylcytosine-specific restriction endonuclease McrA
MGSNEPNAPTLDHIVPISKGGSHIRSNVQLACLECNQAKGNGEASQQNYHGLEKHYTEEVQPKTLWQKFITWAKAVKGAE